MMKAKPWQQLVICLTLFALGIIFVVLGQWSGLALVFVGIIFGLPVILAFKNTPRTSSFRNGKRANEL